MPTPAALTAAIDARLPLVGERGIASVEGRPHELIATSIVSSRISMVTSRRVALAGSSGESVAMVSTALSNARKASSASGVVGPDQRRDAIDPPFSERNIFSAMQH